MSQPIPADLHRWEALSPLDGRYGAQLAGVAAAFCEADLIRRRFQVEVEWLLALSECPEVAELGPLPAPVLRGWVDSFSVDDVAEVKATEARINHDVKAVEYLLRGKLAAAGMASAGPFAHFAATSEDVNNLAYSTQLRDALERLWCPEADRLAAAVLAVAEETAGLAMLGRTHGQAATPTTMGKELAVFVARWRRQIDGLRSLRLTGKWNGATGTYAAHVAAYPGVDWIDLTRRFVEGFALAWNPLTTQIEAHDALAEAFHHLVRFNSVTVDFCRDMWSYVSMGYLAQHARPGEVGSSTMPHKVNPIDFENAEANAGVSSALLGHLATKLTVSRLQRDLSDSSAMRNIGAGVGHSVLALLSAQRGLGRVAPDPVAMAADLDGAWEVLAEAVQTVMRRYGLPEPYEALKALTRGQALGPLQ
ncbi:MAG: adenylosuccinate lyase, partial [Acidimicrobiales bacterium]